MCLETGVSDDKYSLFVVVNIPIFGVWSDKLIFKQYKAYHKISRPKAG